MYLEPPVTGMRVLLIVIMVVKSRSFALFHVSEMPESEKMGE